MNKKLKDQTGFGLPLLFLALVVLALVIVSGLYIKNSHDKEANLQTATDHASTSSALSVTTSGMASPKSPLAAVQSGTSTGKDIQTGSTPTQSTTAPEATVIQPAPNVSAANGTITFSDDGCRVTVSGTPGLLLTGLVMTSNRHKGGPLISPDGLKIPASGSVSAATVYGDFDYATYVIDATLTDGSGAVIASKTTSITSHDCR